nr:hypothetical protein [Pseudomonadota bacterium]
MYKTLNSRPAISLPLLLASLLCITTFADANDSLGILPNADSDIVTTTTATTTTATTTTATTTAFVATNAASETIPTLSPRTPLSLFAAAAGDIPTVPASGPGIEAGVVGGGVAVASGVGDQQDVDFAEGVDVVEVLYPRFAGTGVGAPRPLFDGERWQIFYLNDQRIRRARGYHPWHRASTSDFFHYRDHGLV